MFEVINLLWSVGVATGKALGITLFALSSVNLPQRLDQVAAIEMSSAPYVAIRVRAKTAEEQCRYSGVVVPYEQLWEERTSNAFGVETVTPPQPGKIAAYAIVINRKDCEGRPSEAMFRVATHRRTMFNGDILGEGAQYAVLQLGGMPESARPRWVPQVMDRVVEVAQRDPVAKEFLRFLEESAKAEANAKATDAT